MLVLIEVSYGQKLYSLKKIFLAFPLLIVFRKIVAVNLWKPDIPVSKVVDFIKKVFLFVNVESMQVEDDKDLQHVGILMRLSKAKLLSRFLKFGFSVGKLKSPHKRSFSYEGLKKFNESFISLMKDISFCESGS